MKKELLVFKQVFQFIFREKCRNRFPVSTVRDWGNMSKRGGNTDSRCSLILSNNVGLVISDYSQCYRRTGLVGKVIEDWFNKSRQTEVLKHLAGECEQAGSKSISSSIGILFYETILMQCIQNGESFASMNTYFAANIRETFRINSTIGQVKH